MNYTKYDIGVKELAYIAGFFDGEGCIRVDSKGYLTTIVTNTDVRPLQLFLDVFGGTMCIHSHATTIRKKAYRWSIKSEAVPEFLEMILPYLICKKEEALLALEFVGADMSRKLDIDLELRKLKHQGKVK